MRKQAAAKGSLVFKSSSSL